VVQRSFLWFAVLVLGCGVGATAHAAITYDGHVTLIACDEPIEVAGINLSETAHSDPHPGLHCQAAARTSGSPGALRVRASSSLYGYAATVDTGAGGQANYTVNDFVVTGPGPTASGVMKLRLHGIVNLLPDISGTQFDATTASRWDLTVTSNFGGGNAWQSMGKRIDSEGNTVETSPGGNSTSALTDYDGGTVTLQLPFEGIATGTPLYFFLNLSGSVSADASGCDAPDVCAGEWVADTSASLNLFSTLSFLEGQASFVFDEAGYFANAPSMGVTDNVWTPPVTLVSAVLPASRSVQVGTAATAFVTIINFGENPVSGCSIALEDPSIGTLDYQTTDPATNALTGTLNTPVDIPENNGAQSFLVSLTPGAPFDSRDVAFVYDCDGTSPAATLPGLNTLLVSSAAAPVPDVVALAATLSGNGIVDVPGDNGANAFAVATVNVGVAANITVTADTGATALPLDLFVCQTDAGGQCLAPPAAEVPTFIDASATPTFSIFVNGAGTVADDAAANRVFVRFKDDGGITRGATSVAVRTVN